LFFGWNCPAWRAAFDLERVYTMYRMYIVYMFSRVNPDTCALTTEPEALE
jgi:hypothetical protein